MHRTRRVRQHPLPSQTLDAACTPALEDASGAVGLRPDPPRGAALSVPGGERVEVGMAVDTKAAGPRHPRRRAWLWGVLAMLGAGAVAGYLVLDRGHRAAPSPPVPVTVHLAPFHVSVSGPGALSPARTPALTPSVAGTVLAIASVGDRVAQGEVVPGSTPRASSAPWTTPAWRCRGRRAAWRRCRRARRRPVPPRRPRSTPHSGH